MKRDYKEFPKDDNGEVLWQLRTSGDALREPREIDFSEGWIYIALLVYGTQGRWLVKGRKP